MHYLCPMNALDLSQYVRATDAALTLGYRGRNAVAQLAREGKIEGAEQVNGKIWYVPRSWVEEQQAGEASTGPGKPRGRKNNPKAT